MKNGRVRQEAFSWGLIPPNENYSQRRHSPMPQNRPERPPEATISKTRYDSLRLQAICLRMGPEFSRFNFG